MFLDQIVSLLLNPQFCFAQRRQSPGIGRTELFFYLISCFKTYFPANDFCCPPTYSKGHWSTYIFNMNIALFPASHCHLAWLKLESSSSPFHWCCRTLFPTHGNGLGLDNSPTLCPSLFSDFCIRALCCLDSQGCEGQPALQVL